MNPTNRALRLPAQPRLFLDTARSAHRLLWPRFAGLDREHIWRVDLGPQCCFLGAELVAIGTAEAAIMHPRELFKGAIQAGAWRVMLAHNHVSGIVMPSRMDRRLTARLALCGFILGIEIMDHLIIHEGEMFSFREAGLMKAACVLGQNRRPEKPRRALRSGEFSRAPEGRKERFHNRPCGGG